MLKVEPGLRTGFVQCPQKKKRPESAFDPLLPLNSPSPANHQGAVGHDALLDLREDRVDLIVGQRAFGRAE